MWSTTQDSPTIFSFIVGLQEEHIRLDLYINKQLPQFSRSFIQKLITGKHILINNHLAKPSTLVKPADDIVVQIPTETPTYIINPSEEETKILKDLDVTIVHQEKDFMVLSKPSNLLVHRPFATAKEITLVDWLCYKVKEISSVGHPKRPGIVHRLDKDTSGLIIVPLNNFSHNTFGNLFKDRALKKTYYALVEGYPDKEGTIDLPIGRDPHVRNRMTINGIGSRESQTNYKVVTYFENSDASLVEVNPVSGRTHQIRVHFKALGHPIIGDAVYGKESKYINRQALHAAKLNFAIDGKKYSLESELPKDFQTALQKIETQKIL